MYNSSKFNISSSSQTSIIMKRKSVFDGNENTKSGGRIYFFLAFFCCILMMICALLLICVPPEVWSKFSHHNTYEVTYIPGVHKTFKSNEFCNHTVGVGEDTPCEVTCIGITGDNPGDVVAEYLLNIWEGIQVECPPYDWSLHINASQFPGNTMSSDWLSKISVSQLEINKLTIRNCPSLIYIEGGALSNKPLELKELTLTNLKGLNQLTREMTEGLTKLKHFIWRENAEMEYVEVDALKPFKSTLQILELTGGFSNSNMLAKLIGECASSKFYALLTLDLRFSPDGEGMRQLARGHMSAAPKLQQIFMRGSGIEHLEDNVFKPMAGSLVTVELNDNALTTLREEVLEPLRQQVENVSLSLADNLWVCDCNLAWLQNIMRDPSSNILILDNPQCSTPSEDFLIDADLSYCGEFIPPPDNIVISCDEEDTTTTTPSVTTPISSTTYSTSTTTASSTTSAESTTTASTTPSESTTTSGSTTPSGGTTPSESTTTSGSMTSTESTTPELSTTSSVSTSTDPTVSMTCKDYNNVPCKNIKSRTRRDSSVNFPSQIPNFRVSKNIRDTNDNIEVIIEIGQAQVPNARLVWSTSNGSLVDCYENLQEEMCITNLKNDKAYLFCMILNESDYTFPTHCIPIQTEPKWKHDDWLTNDSQPLVISTSTILLIFAIVLGAGGVILLFKNNPTLLSHINKRVIKVFTPYQDAIIRPRQSSTLGSVRSSIISDCSTPSYISVQNVSGIRLYALRFRDWLRRNNAQPESHIQHLGTPSQANYVSRV